MDKNNLEDFFSVIQNIEHSYYDLRRTFNSSIVKFCKTILSEYPKLGDNVEDVAITLMYCYDEEGNDTIGLDRVFIDNNNRLCFETNRGIFNIEDLEIDSIMNVAEYLKDKC